MARIDLTLALQRFDIREFCYAHGAEREGSDELLLTCPVCHEPKLTVNVVNRMWRCFRCEKYTTHAVTGKKSAVTGAGNLFTLVQLLNGGSGHAAAEYIAQHAKGVPDDGTLPQIAAPKAEVIRQPTGLPEKTVAITTVLPYMERRGISLADAKEFGLGWVPPEAGGWVANRIIFPVWERGQCLYWQARACWDEKEHVPRWPGDTFKKSLNPRTERDGVHYMGSTDVVLNLEQAAACANRVVITEGPTSAIRVGRDAVATFGKQLSPKQVGKLVAFGVKAVDFMWDGPTPGKSQQWGKPNVCPCHGNTGCAWASMSGAAKLLQAHGIDVKIVFLPEGDPGDYTRQQLWQFRFAAVPAWANTLSL